MLDVNSDWSFIEYYSTNAAWNKSLLQVKKKNYKKERRKMGFGAEVENFGRTESLMEKKEEEKDSHSSFRYS